MQLPNQLTFARIARFKVALVALAAIVLMGSLATTAQAGHPRHCGIGYGGIGYRGVNYGGWSGGWGCSSIRLSFGCAPVRAYCRPFNNCFPAPICPPVNCYRTYRYCPPVNCYDPCIGFGYGYMPRSSYYYNTPTWGYYGSTFEPAENGFGPAAVDRFLGTGDRNAVRPAAPAVVVKPKFVFPPLVAKKPFDPSAVRVSNASQRSRADQWIAQGDMLFREQKYHSAAQRYKLASESAPDVAESYWRIGHAYVASNRFPEAAENFRRAIALSPTGIARDGFDLNKLYGSATIARDSHLEALAAVALTDDTNSDALFLLGVQLTYQGHADRAADFFAAATKNAGDNAASIAAFAPKKAPTTAAKPAAAKDVVPVAAELEI